MPARIYTCTPVPFAANRGFFIRDTGLLCLNLRALGAECCAVMPEPGQADDLPAGESAPYLRVPYEKLESADWWRSQHLDGVILYSWAAPRYTPIARAIHDAGVRLIVHLDATEDFQAVVPGGDRPLARLKTALKEWVQNKRRARHLAYADAVTMSAAAGRVLVQRGTFGNAFAEKLQPMPCPVAPQKVYDGTPKRNLIVAVGRWNDLWQKRPEMLQQTLELLFTEAAENLPADAAAEIYGAVTPELQAWHAALPAALQVRIRLCGYVDNDELTAAYRAARVCLCTSRFEGCHISSAEAVCCGCAVVTPPRPGQLTVVQGYTEAQSGTVAREDTPQALAQAVCDELRAWKEQRRDPAAIAAAWQPVLHADRVLKRLFPEL